MARAFLFPGQGSQSVGMGQALAQASAAARETFEEVDDALAFRLSRLMFEGPERELTLTANAQPAIMAVSIATLRVAEREGGIVVQETADYVAGHSLGEYSALCAAGSLSLADTARLLRTRGDAMQAAVPVGVGAMAALIGADVDAAAAIAAEAVAAFDAEGRTGRVVAVANDNGAGQVVISGHAAAVERAVELAKARGVKRAVMLAVSAPFHSPLMAPAADTIAAALASAHLARPFAPLVSNVTAAPVTDPEELRLLLVRQVVERVRWRECVLAMAADVSGFVEFGARVVGPMTRRIAPDATAQSLVTMDDIEQWLQTL